MSCSFVPYATSSRKKKEKLSSNFPGNHHHHHPWINIYETQVFTYLINICIHIITLVRKRKEKWRLYIKSHQKITCDLLTIPMLILSPLPDDALHQLINTYIMHLQLGTLSCKTRSKRMYDYVKGLEVW